MGTERHESRRIDNQLRGRSGRQGDPGHSKFFLSLQDDLMRIFPVESMDSMLGKLGLEQGESITHPWVTKAIERAQAKVEARNFDIRKNILKYDDVMNDQRKVIFAERLELMDAEDVAETIAEMRHECHRQHHCQVHPRARLSRAVAVRAAAKQPARPTSTSRCRSTSGRMRKASTSSRCASASPSSPTRRPPPRSRVSPPRSCARSKSPSLLQSIDGLWREHLVTLDHLSKVVGWRGLAQRDPLNEYKQEAYELFQKLLTDLRELVTTQLSHVEIQAQPAPPPRDFSGLSEIHIDPTDRRERRRRAIPARCGRPHCQRHACGTLGTASLDGGVTEADPCAPPDRPQAAGGRLAQRPLPLRFRQEVQALSRRVLGRAVVCRDLK